MLGRGAEHETEQVKAFLASGHPMLAFGVVAIRALRLSFLGSLPLVLFLLFPQQPKAVANAVIALASR